MHATERHEVLGGAAGVFWLRGGEENTKLSRSLVLQVL